MTQLTQIEYCMTQLSILVHCIQIIFSELNCSFVYTVHDQICTKLSTSPQHKSSTTGRGAIPNFASESHEKIRSASGLTELKCNLNTCGISVRQSFPGCQ